MIPIYPIPSLLLVRSSRGPEIVARSEGVEFAHEEFAHRTAVAYGDGGGEFEAVFALSCDAGTVVVTTVTAAGAIKTFAMLFVPVDLYRWVGDPFALAAAHAISPAARGMLSPISHWNVPRAPRTVAELQGILKNGDSPFLLGAAQAMLDGTRIRIAAAEPSRQIRDLWQLLPDSTRGEVWPCEYCLSDELPFHIAALPRVSSPLPRGTIGEEQVRDYPAARYEMALQAAVEAGDQRWLDELLSRHSPRTVLKLSLVMLAFAFVAAVLIKLLGD